MKGRDGRNHASLSLATANHGATTPLDHPRLEAAGGVPMGVSGAPVQWGVASSSREAADSLRAAAADGRLDALCQRHGLRLLTAFGSATRDDVEVPGDLDLAFAAVSGVEVDIVGLLGDLVEMTGCEVVDLMDLSRAGPVAKERALAGGVPLYQRDPGDYARAQMAAILERMETAWLRRLDLEAMRG